RPNDEGLTSTHVAGGVDLVYRGLVGERVGKKIAALVEVSTKLAQHAFGDGTGKADGEEHEVSLDDELGAFDRLARTIDTGAFDAGNVTLGIADDLHRASGK